MRLLLFICLFASTAFAQFDNVAFLGGTAVATSGFDPSTVSGYTIDYDVHALGLSNGDLISTLTDKSANKYHALAVGLGRPYWTNNAAIGGGKGFAYFDGTTNWMGTNIGITLSQPNTCFIVCILPALGAGTPHIFDAGTGYASGRNVLYSTIGLKSQIYSGLAFDYATLYDASILANKVYIFEISFNGTSSGVWTNGVVTQGGTGSAGTEGQRGITIGDWCVQDGANLAKFSLWRLIWYNADVLNSNSTHGYGGTGNASNIVYYLKNLYGQ